MKLTLYNIIIVILILVICIYSFYLNNNIGVKINNQINSKIYLIDTEYNNYILNKNIETKFEYIKIN